MVKVSKSQEQANAGIPRFMLLMWGHCGKRKLCKSRILGITKGEENRIEL